MIAIKWRIECRSHDCSTWKRTRRVAALDVDGTKAEAIKAARAAGWLPCCELIGGRRTLNSWWCPSCVAYITERRADQARINSRIQALLDRSEAAKLPSRSTTEVS